MTQATIDHERHAPTRKGEARRTRLLETAAESFLRVGYAETSMQKIVSEAGGSAATVYQLFGNKEGLLIAVLQREFEHMQTHVFPEVAPDLPAAQALGALAERLLHYSVQPRSAGFYRLLMSEGHRLEQIVVFLRRQIAEQIHEPIERCLRHACERGELVIAEPAPAARMLGYLMHGITHEARITGGYAQGPTAEDLAACRYCIDTFLRAFRR